MAADSEIIKEFLVSLGFKIDEAGARKFKTGLTDTTKTALGVSAAVVGVGIAVEKFVEQMTDGLSKLFYVSQRTGATVSNLKATEAAFQGIGMQAGVATEAIENVADQMRNPALVGRLKAFGINVDQDKAKVMLDLVKKLSDLYNTPGGGMQVPAEGLAEDFLGTNARQFEQLRDDLPALTQQFAQYQQLMASTGVDMNDLAKDSVEFQRTLKLMGNEFGALGTELLGRTLPAMNSFMHDLEHILGDAVKMAAVSDPAKGGEQSIWRSMYNMLTTGEAVGKTDSSAGAPGSADPQLEEALRKQREKHAAGASKDELAAYAAATAQKFGLDPDAIVAQLMQESNLDPKARSSAGAVGVAQFTPGTAKDRGFVAGQDPMEDIRQMVAYMAELTKKYGDLQTAEMAYNAGQGRIDDQLAGGSKYGPLAQETIDYPMKIQQRMENARLGGATAANGSDNGGTKNVTMNQGDVIVTVHAADADATARVIDTRVRSNNSDATRNLKGLLATPGR